MVEATEAEMTKMIDGMTIQKFQIAAKNLMKRVDHPLFRMSEVVANSILDLLARRFKEFNRSNEKAVFEIVSEIESGAVKVNSELEELAKLHELAYELMGAIDEFTTEHPVSRQDLFPE